MKYDDVDSLYDGSEISSVKLWNPVTEAWEVAKVNTPYLSPNQHGSIYGVVYRQYFLGESLPADTTSDGDVSKLIDFCLYVQNATDRYTLRGGEDSNNAVVKLDFLAVAGKKGLTILVDLSYTVLDGWIDYTR